MEDDIISKRLKKFNAKRDEDFMLWSVRLEFILESKELLSTVERDLVGIDKMALSDELKTKNAKACMILVQSLGYKPLRSVIGEKKNPFLMYKKLKERYATQKTATRVQCKPSHITSALMTPKQCQNMTIP